MNEKLEQKLTSLLYNKQFTMPILYNKPYSENYISDWLAFILNPDINGLGNEPLNILLALAGHEPISDSDETDFLNVRENGLGDDGRIDFLIPIKNKDTNQLKYFIAIENKIWSCEGKNQTDKYYNHITTKKSNNKDNVFIFLTPFGTEAENENFANVSYKDFIDKLKQIDISNIQEKCRVYIKSFIDHIETYILFSEKDCELLNNGECIEREFGKLPEKDQKEGVLHDAHSRLLELKRLFFKLLENKIKKTFPNDEWEHNSKQTLIQLYKKEWNPFGIHYEIIIPNCSVIYSDCELLMMIHAEDKSFGYKSVEESYAYALNKHLINSLPEYNPDNFNNIQYKKKKITVYQEKTIKLPNFRTPNGLDKFIEDLVERLLDLVKNTHKEIDVFIEKLEK